jgi:hypothetical protein
MKFNAKSLFLTLGLAALAAGVNNAYARSTTGFSAFHVQFQGTLSANPYLCLGEYWGAVVNNCSYPVSLEFNLPIDNTGEAVVVVQDYWEPFGTANAAPSFSCQAFSYGGSTNGPGGFLSGAPVSFTQPGQTLTAQVKVPSNGWSIQLICWNVPPGAGIANINWNIDNL